MRIVTQTHRFSHATRHAALVSLFLPFAGLMPAQDLATGEAIFNSNCAFCHGTDGSGGRGPSLRASLRTGNLDADIAQVIRNGIPGTAMPKFSLEDDEMQSLVMHVQSFRKASPPIAPVEGDKIAGKRVYEAQGCANCHEIGNHGSALGPNLTRIGAARSYDYLKTSLVDPSADIPAEYQTVRILTRDGKRIQGAWVNEDSFTVQVRLTDESFASFDKQALKELVHDKKSIMPAYRLSASDQKNLLAYLNSLTGDNGAVETRSERRSR